MVQNSTYKSQNLFHNTNHKPRKPQPPPPLQYAPVCDLPPVIIAENRAGEIADGRLSSRLFGSRFWKRQQQHIHYDEPSYCITYNCVVE